MLQDDYSFRQNSNSKHHIFLSSIIASNPEEIFVSSIPLDHPSITMIERVEEDSKGDASEASHVLSAKD